LLVLSLLIFVIPSLEVSSNPYSFNIEDFGADRTGTRPSSLAIQTAINQAQAVGGEVVIPPGNFLLNETIVLSNSVQIRGINPHTCVLRGSLGGGRYLMSVQARGVVLNNIGYVGLDETTSCVQFYNSFLVDVNNLEMTTCFVALWIEQTGNIDVMTVNIWSYHLYGVRMLDLNGDIFLDKIHANTYPNQNPGVIGLYMSNVSGSKITNSDLIAGQVGVLMDLATSQPSPTNEWNQFLSVDCDTVGLDAWHIVSAHGLQLSECWSGTFIKGTGLWFGPDVQQVSVVNHQWQSGYVGVGNNGHGIGITGGIMANVQLHINSAVAGEPTIVNLKEF